MSYSTNIDVIQGALKLIGRVQGVRWESAEAFVSWLIENIGVEIPPGTGNVLVQSSEPGASKRDSLWIRSNAAGSFIGVYVYGGGDWQKILPVPYSMTRMYGDSANLPAGFALVSNAIPGISTEMATFIKASWHAKGEGYDVFDAVFIGF